MEKKNSFWEILIAIMIILAIAQIFLEDISRLRSDNVSLRTILIILGFLFDFFFTIEFIARSISSKKRKGWWNYIINEKGWIDFLSSLPLLIFNSGPIMIGIILPGKLLYLPLLGMFNILKVAKIIRIARLLRFARVLKFFAGKSGARPEAADTESRQLQLNRIITLSVFTIIIILVISPLFPDIFYNMETRVKERNDNIYSIIEDWKESLKKRDLERIKNLNFLFEEDKNILFIYYRRRPIVNHLDKPGKPENIIPKKYFYTDYKILRHFDVFKIYYSIEDIVAENARVNLLIETLIVFLILVLLIFYSDPYKKKEN